MRLVKHYKFADTDDANKHLTAYLAINAPLHQYFERFDEHQLEDEIKRLVKMLNQNIQEKVIHVSFEKVEDFLESVLLNPFAPDWLNETLEIFCNNNDINYIGKSQLYQK
ncbi:MAG: hypothetical protein ABFS12_17185 [Bacteroidota bacterium]